MTHLYGRGPKDARLADATPHRRWHTTTFVGGQRESGIVAPLVLDGPMTGEAFLAYVEQMLVPELMPATSSGWTNFPPTTSRASTRLSVGPVPLSSA